MSTAPEGTLTVAEAARRLHTSAERVRRDLRKGRLKGRRVGNRWLLDARALDEDKDRRPLLDPELLARIDKLREEIFQRHGYFDVVAMINKDREEH